MKLPQARTDNLIEQDLDREMLIYDLVANKAYTLNETSSIVYKACDGEMTFGELRHCHKFTDELIYLALDQLQRCELLADVADYLSPHAELNRREIIRKAGLGSMMALPVISALIVPTATNAASNQTSTACGGTSGSPCSRIDCDECCDGGLYDVIIVSGCRACRCLSGI
jgi:hypothetical protein